MCVPLLSSLLGGPLDQLYLTPCLWQPVEKSLFLKKQLYFGRFLRDVGSTGLSLLFSLTLHILALSLSWFKDFSSLFIDIQRLRISIILQDKILLATDAVQLFYLDLVPYSLLTKMAPTC